MDEEVVRKRLAGAATELLRQWNLGYDWRWTAGEPPRRSKMTELDITTAIVDYRTISAIRNFIVTFVDARWQGLQECEGMPWEDAVALLLSIQAYFQRGTAIENARLYEYSDYDTSLWSRIVHASPPWRRRA